MASKSASENTGPARGRGISTNPASRYNDLRREQWYDGWHEEPIRLLATEVLPDKSRRAINYNRSSDIEFDRSVNPYRGCEHGCSYCYARPSHAYLGLSPGRDFESRLFAKYDMPTTLEMELERPGYECRPIALGVNTDAWQPIERRLGITRRILQVLDNFNQPVRIITKSSLVERDSDILGAMAARNLVSVSISVATLDHRLARAMEPRAPTPRRRLETIRRLSGIGIPTGVMLAPVIPGLTDTEIESILDAAANAGATFARYTMLRLPLELSSLFPEWLENVLPLQASKVMNRIRGVRDGKTNDPRFGSRMTGNGVYAELIAQRFNLTRRKAELDLQEPTLNEHLFNPQGRSGGQLTLF